MDYEETSGLRQMIVLLLVLAAVIFGLVYYFFIVREPSESETSVADDPNTTPQNVVVSNITSNSATVSWYTNGETTGSVSSGTNRDNLTISATDTQGATTSSRLHYVVISGLEPTTTYYFSIQSGGATFTDSGYLFATFALEDTVAESDAITITAPEDFSEGIVYAHASDGTNASTTSSSFSTSRFITLQTDNLKESSDGRRFDLSDSNIQIYLIDSELNSARTTVQGSVEDTEVSAFDSIGSNYSPSSIFTLAGTSDNSGDSGITDSTGTQETTDIDNSAQSGSSTDVTDTETSTDSTDQDITSQSTTTTTTGTTGQTQETTTVSAKTVPDTAIGSGTLRVLGIVIGGFSLIVIGLSLKKG